MLRHFYYALFNHSTNIFILDRCMPEHASVFLLLYTSYSVRIAHIVSALKRLALIIQPELHTYYSVRIAHLLFWLKKKKYTNNPTQIR